MFLGTRVCPAHSEPRLPHARSPPPSTEAAGADRRTPKDRSLSLPSSAHRSRCKQGGHAGPPGAAHKADMPMGGRAARSLMGPPSGLPPALPWLSPECRTAHFAPHRGSGASPSDPRREHQREQEHLAFGGNEAAGTSPRVSVSQSSLLPSDAISLHLI